MTRSSDLVIIGAGLTGLTLAFYLQKAGKKVILLDKKEDVGGVIDTVKTDGFSFETGPSTGTLSSPELVSLFRDLKGKCELAVANPDSKKRWIWKGEKWHALPSGMVDGLRTPLFKWSDKFRILGEPFRKKGDDPFETIANLVRRRLGQSFLDYAVDPFISGIYAGDPEKLITRFALPKLYQLEQKYGSFIKGAIKKSNEPKSELDKNVTREVFSVKGGLKGLINALNTSLDDDTVMLSCNDITIKYLSDYKYTITGKDESGETFTLSSKHVITTTGAYALAELLPFLNDEQLAPINNLNYAKVVQVAAGYNQWQGIKLGAFGGLVPSHETPQVLGILFPSSIFPDRAPKGGALLSVFMGGVKNEGIYDLEDDDVIQLALEEIKRTLQTDQKPDLLRICRYRYAIAQYEKSSEKRLQRIDELQKQYPGLILAGNMRDGIGMSDRIKQAVGIAQQLS